MISLLPNEGLVLEEFELRLMLGESRNQVLDKIGRCDSHFSRSEDESTYVEEYERFSLFINYSKENTVDAFEFYGTKGLFLLETDLSEKSFLGIKNIFLALDANSIIKITSVTSLQYGVGIWTGNILKLDNPPESLILFKHGYYD